MKKFEKGKTLIVADIHQCLSYANWIFENEKDFDNVVFLGDYFDCFEFPDNKKYFNVSSTCDWLNKKFQELGDRAVWLLGNHDLAYIATFVPNNYPSKNTFYSCAGYTESKATAFNNAINPDWMNNLELCCQVGDFVCSHAGFHYNHFRPFISEIDNIEEMHNAWETDKFEFKFKPFHWINYVGSCRGGMEDIGSPIWLDWRFEFVPLDNVRQIVGHTCQGRLRFGKKAFDRDNNLFDYCIDSYRSCYAIHENNKLEIKFLPKEIL